MLEQLQDSITPRAASCRTSPPSNLAMLVARSSWASDETWRPELDPIDTEGAGRLTYRIYQHTLERPDGSDAKCELDFAPAASPALAVAHVRVRSTARQVEVYVHDPESGINAEVGDARAAASARVCVAVEKPTPPFSPPPRSATRTRSRTSSRSAASRSPTSSRRSARASPRAPRSSRRAASSSTPKSR